MLSYRQCIYNAPGSIISKPTLTEKGSEEICSYHQMFSRQKLQKIIFD